MQCYALQGERIATPSVRTGFAMTEVFGSFRTYFAASCIEKYVIPRERSDRGNPFPRHLKNAIA